MLQEEQSYQDWINSIRGNFPYKNPAPSLTKPPLLPNRPIPVIASGIVYRREDDPIEDWEKDVQKFARQIDKASLLKAKEAGFNIGMQSSLSDAEETKGDHKNIYNSFINALEANVNLLIFTSFLLTTEGKNFLTTTKNSNGQSLIDAFAGFKLADEPSYEDLISNPEVLQNNYKKFMELYGSVSNCIAYINLLGSYVEKAFPSDCSDTEDQCYLKYLEAYQNNFKPSFFCYDFYPISEINNLLYEGYYARDLPFVNEEEGTLKVFMPSFYGLLRIYSNFSTKFNRPFWVFCESNNFISFYEERGLHPIALEQYLRYEAFSALAFGAKGIVYWTYATEMTNSDQASLSAVTNRRNEKTAVWYYAKKINEEIQKYKNIFLESSIQEIVGDEDDKDAETIYKYPSNSTIIKIQRTNNEFIISRMNNGFSTFIIVVNKSPFEYKTLNLSVLSGDIYEETSLNSEKVSYSTRLTIGSYSRIMPPGGYRIFSLRDPI